MDDLVRNFDYKEKPDVFKYYPQYYHKIDKVWRSPLALIFRTTTKPITLGWSACVH